MIISEITSDERMLLIHAVGWAIDRLNKDMERLAKTDNDKLSFIKAIEQYKIQSLYIKGLKP